MSRRLRIYITKRQTQVVFVNDVGGDFAFDNLREDGHRTESHKRLEGRSERRLTVQTKLTDRRGLLRLAVGRQNSSRVDRPLFSETKSAKLWTLTKRITVAYKTIKEAA
ncbi:MAG: hypothetical protein Fues2KO_50800 [Fuerstiella sp.]